MEAGIEQPHPKQPAQQDQQPSLHNEADSSLSAEGTNGAAQPPSPDSPPPPPPLFPSESDTASLTSISSDAASEVISPSVSSPPYWTHSHAASQPQNHLLQTPTSGPGHSHTRAVSSASVESVLPPGAITLQDNEREDDDDDGGNGEREYTGRRSNSSELYGRDRNRACWARSVQVTDYVLVNGSTTNLGAFVVWLIGVETLNGSRMNIRKRYSEFDGLRKRLVQTFPNFEAAVPALPPKSVLKRFHPKFLEKRRAGLQYFLNCILLNPEFSGSPVLKEFLFS